MELHSLDLQGTSFREAKNGRISLSKSDRDGSDEQNVGRAFRVLIVDRDPMSSDLLAAELMRDRDCHASSVPCTDLLRRLGTDCMDLVVIGAELNHGSINGSDLARQVSRTYPNVWIIILLDQSTPASVIDAFRSGARGIFSRQRPLAEFRGCVKHVRKGFIFATERETAFLLEAFRGIPPPPAAANNALPLSMRELQVVRCAAKGKTNKAIASEVGLSEHTVKNYLFRAFEKLGVSNRVELLLYLTAGGYASGQTQTEDPEAVLSAEKTPA